MQGNANIFFVREINCGDTTTIFLHGLYLDEVKLHYQPVCHVLRVSRVHVAIYRNKITQYSHIKAKLIRSFRTEILYPTWALPLNVPNECVLYGYIDAVVHCYYGCGCVTLSFSWLFLINYCSSIFLSTYRMSTVESPCDCGFLLTGA